MSMADLFLIVGVFALSVALRTTGSVVLHKIGVLGYLSTSFLAGWLLTGWWPMGLVFVSLFEYAWRPFFMRQSLKNDAEARLLNGFRQVLRRRDEH